MTVPLPAPPIAGVSGPSQLPKPAWGFSGLIVRLLPVLLPLALFIIAGLIGIDFGSHWDEKDHIQNIHDSLQNDIFLPMGAHAYDGFPGLKGGYYGYPSVIYWIGLFSATPEIVKHADNLASPDLLDFINSPQFLLRLRAVCLVISSFSILWLYLLVLALRKSWPLALFAASLLACSWEYGYHARWVATDDLVTQFAALCLLLCALALQNPRWTRRLLQFAAAVAGLAAGTKYPAGLLILPVIITAALADGNKLSISRRLLQLIQLFVILLVVFILTTPGALLQPNHFVTWLQFDRRRYANHSNAAYSILDQAQYLRLSLDYLCLVFFSPYTAISAALSCLGIVGIVASLKRGWKLLAVILVFPVLYLAYFSTQGMLVVRNLLVMTPFLAILITLGVACLFKYLPWRWPRWIAAAILAACLAINAAWAIYAAISIPRSKDPAYEIRQLADYLHDHPHTHFYVTPAVNAKLLQYTGNAWTNQPITADDPSHIVVVQNSTELEMWMANRRNLLLKWFGPLEVNINYYSGWKRNHIVLMNNSEIQKYAPDATRFFIRQHREVQKYARLPDVLAAYFDCGALNQAPQFSNEMIHSLNGAPWSAPFVGVGSSTFSSQLFDANDLKFQITGMDPHRQYTVGVAWWDYLGQGRVQSVYVNSPGKPPRLVLGPLPLPQWLTHEGKPPEPAAELSFILPQDITAGGTAELTIHHDPPASNTIVSDIWLLQRPLDAPAPH